MAKVLRRGLTSALPDLAPTENAGGEAVFDTAFVARSLDRLIAGRLQDLETLRHIALDANAGMNGEALHRQLLMLTHSAREAYDGLQQSRDILIGLHKQATGGEVVAAVDAVTGLPNRSAFSVRLSEHLKRMDKAHTVSLMVIELGALQVLANEAGTIVANRVVKRLAVILRRAVKRTDYVSRIGPQHFAVLFEEILPQKAVPIALRVHDAIEAKLSPAGSPVTGALSVTIGIAGASGPASSAAELLQKAYEAIAQARKEGRPAIYVA